MGKKSARQKAFTPADYDQPTEPVERLILPPTAPMGGWYAENQNVPSPQAETCPYPPGYAPVYPYDPYVQQPSALPDYPVLPPAPYKQYRGQPPGGATPTYQPLFLRRRHRSPVPGLVGVCLMLVQLVLLARVICMLFGLAATTFWLNLLFVTSDVFVEPLRWLAANFNLAPLAGTQLLVYLEFLLAILAYGICSRILVGLLKLVFR